jgi:CRP/FNR family transcriptional regulator
MTAGGWLDGFPDLQGLDPTSGETLLAAAQAVSVPHGARVFEPGGACTRFLLIVSGTVRVQQLSESGREIVLYRITGGDTCVLTTASLLAHQHYAAEAIAETAVDAIALPRDAFDRLMADSATFRDFVFRSYASRLTNLLLLVEEVAFGRMDTRLAERLVARCGADGIVALTHHDLAVELGTAREVVSRQLKEFERRGWVTLERGRVIVTDEQGLRSLSRPS